MSNKMDETGSKASGLGSMMGLGGPLGMGLAVAVGGPAVAVGAEAIHMAEGFDTATGRIAASAGISEGSAKKIGDAFLTTGGQVTFSGTEMATAYAGVAGQLGLMEGHALNAQQALGFMKSATDLAEASGMSLGNATTDLAKIMQIYGVSVNARPGEQRAVQYLTGDREQCGHRYPGVHPPSRQHGCNDTAACPNERPVGRSCTARRIRSWWHQCP